MNARVHFILKTLSGAKPFALPESALHQALNDKVRPEVSQKDFQKLLVELEADRFIARLSAKYEDEARWAIREAGEAALLR